MTGTPASTRRFDTFPARFHSAYRSRAHSGLLCQPRYFAYGRERTPSLAALPTDYTYTGQKQDGSGLVYMNARYYDPLIGQFISPDTVVPDATNLFAYNRFMYVNGNPLRYNDPSGHCGTAVVSGGSTAALDLVCWEIMGAAASEVAPPAAAAAATVAMVGGGYIAVQWALQDNGPDVPPLYPTVGQHVGDGNISITIPVPGSTTMTSGVPLTPGAQTQSTGVTAVNQPAQQLVEPLPANEPQGNIYTSRLDTNMQQAGMVRPANTAAHHIVAENDPRAATSWRILTGANLNVNDAANGVYLPANSNVANPTGANVHSILHTDRYYQEVERRLLNRGNQSVQGVLQRIRQQLLNGTFPR